MKQASIYSKSQYKDVEKGQKEKEKDEEDDIEEDREEEEDGEEEDGEEEEEEESIVRQLKAREAARNRQVQERLVKERVASVPVPLPALRLKPVASNETPVKSEIELNTKLDSALDRITYYRYTNGVSVLSKYMWVQMALLNVADWRKWPAALQSPELLKSLDATDMALRLYERSLLPDMQMYDEARKLHAETDAKSLHTQVESEYRRLTQTNKPIPSKWSDAIRNRVDEALSISYGIQQELCFYLMANPGIAAIAGATVDLTTMAVAGPWTGMAIRAVWRANPRAITTTQFWKNLLVELSWGMVGMGATSALGTSFLSLWIQQTLTGVVRAATEQDRIAKNTMDLELKRIEFDMLAKTMALLKKNQPSRYQPSGEVNNEKLRLDAVAHLNSYKSLWVSTGLSLVVASGLMLLDPKSLSLDFAGFGERLLQVLTTGMGTGAVDPSTENGFTKALFNLAGSLGSALMTVLYRRGLVTLLKDLPGMRRVLKEFHTIAQTLSEQILAKQRPDLDMKDPIVSRYVADWVQERTGLLFVRYITMQGIKDTATEILQENALSALAVAGGNGLFKIVTEAKDKASTLQALTTELTHSFAEAKDVSDLQLILKAAEQRVMESNAIVQGMVYTILQINALCGQETSQTMKDAQEGALLKRIQDLFDIRTKENEKKTAYELGQDQKRAFTSTLVPSLKQDTKDTDTGEKSLADAKNPRWRRLFQKKYPEYRITDAEYDLFIDANRTVGRLSEIQIINSILASDLGLRVDQQQQLRFAEAQVEEEVEGKPKETAEDETDKTKKPATGRPDVKARIYHDVLKAIRMMGFGAHVGEILLLIKRNPTEAAAWAGISLATEIEVRTTFGQNQRLVNMMLQRAQANENKISSVIQTAQEKANQVLDFRDSFYLGGTAILNNFALKHSRAISSRSSAWAQTYIKSLDAPSWKVTDAQVWLERGFLYALPRLKMEMLARRDVGDKYVDTLIQRTIAKQEKTPELETIEFFQESFMYKAARFGFDHAAAIASALTLMGTVALDKGLMNLHPDAGVDTKPAVIDLAKVLVKEEVMPKVVPIIQQATYDPWSFLITLATSRYTPKPFHQKDFYKWKQNVSPTDNGPSSRQSLQGGGNKGGDAFRWTDQFWVMDRDSLLGLPKPLYREGEGDSDNLSGWLTRLGMETLLVDPLPPSMDKMMLVFPSVLRSLDAAYRAGAIRKEWHTFSKPRLYAIGRYGEAHHEMYKF